MDPNTVFLNPENKLVDEVADWLLGRPATERNLDNGALSLAHVCVVVPTAQSGRNLRLALAKKVAKRFHGKGLVPPMVKLPMQLAAPADESLREATDAEVAAAFLKFSETRPRRHEKDGEVVLDEWTKLFHPESFDDPDALFSFLDQLSDIWNILGAGGLLMRDVPESEEARVVFLEKAPGDEKVRWDELADLETAFFAFLRDRGLRHRAESIRLAKTAPKALPEGVDQVVLPALADPVPVLYDVLEHLPGNPTVTILYHCDKAESDKFDRWGRPEKIRWTEDNRPVVAGLADEDIVRAASDATLAERLARDFPTRDSGKEIPSLGLCDENLFPELSGAFSVKGYELHDPARFRLSASSLGRIAERLLSLYACGGDPWPWDDFAALLREHDVLRRFTSKDAHPMRTETLEGLDAYRNAAFPATVPQDADLPMDCFDPADEHQKDDLDRALQFKSAAQAFARSLRDARTKPPHGPASFLRRALADIYRRIPLRPWKDAPAEDGETEPPDRLRERERDAAEFLAAIQSLLGALSPFEDETIRDLGLSDALQTALLRRALSNAAYSLEPDSDRILTTEGWLELAWSGKDKIALAGFCEGAVPETVAGHVFLPDKLRAALGLPSNGSRLARDTFLLRSIVGSRKEHAVRAYFARTDKEGDIHRPSRLLFLVDDAALPRRVQALFGPLPDTATVPARTIATEWRPRLSSDVPLPANRDEKTSGVNMSPSSVDSWLKCPFAHFLEHRMKLRRLDDKDELEANDFGSFVHKVLEKYALAQLAKTGDGRPQALTLEEIKDDLRAAFDEVRAAYGTSPGLKIRLQLESAWARLENFAEVQAFWAGAGWRIAAKPELDFRVRPFADDGDPLLADVWIKGTVDRLDYKEGVGYRLVDYKTWDERGKIAAHVLAGGGEQLAHAAAMGLPTTDERTAKGEPKASRRFLTVQPALYARCLENARPEDLPGFDGPMPVPVVDLCYLVLGKTLEDTAVFGSKDDQGRFKTPKTGVQFVLAEHAGTALESARVAIRRIRQGVFWPPAPGKALRYDLAEAFLDSAEKDLADSDWVREQEERLAAAMAEKAEETGTEDAQ